MVAGTRYYYADDQSPAARAFEQRYQDELHARRAAYLKRWDYYYGNHKRQLAPDGSNTDDNVIINLCELLVDKGVSALMGTTEQGIVEGPSFEIVQPEAEGMLQTAGEAMRGMMQKARGVMQGMLGKPPDAEDPADEWLDAVWEANLKPILLHDVATNGGVCGSWYLKIMPDELPDGLPRLVNLNPANVTPIWFESDVDRVLCYRIEFGNEKLGLYDPGRTRQDIVRSVDEAGNDLGGWRIIDYTEKANGVGWVRGTEQAWPYEWPPIIEGKNLPKPNDHYGLDDLRSATGVNDSLNFVLSNTQRIIKYHADPKTVATGIEDDGLTASGIGSLWTTANADAKVYNLEMQSDLSSSMNFAGLLRRSFFDNGREVDSSTIQDKVGQLTNFGLRVLYRDSLGKTGTKRLLAGHALKTLCQHLLELGGFGADVQVKVSWKDPLPTDPLQTAQALQIDRANGLSKTTYLDKRGYDADTEAENRQLEGSEDVFTQTVMRQGALVDRMRNPNGGNMQQPGPNGMPMQGNGNNQGMMGNDGQSAAANQR